MRETPRRRRRPTTNRTVSPVTFPPGRRIGSTRPAIHPSSRSGSPGGVYCARQRAQTREPTRKGELTMGSEMREMHQESTEGMENMTRPPQPSRSNPRGGHLYMQTNEVRNAIVHYDWSRS